MVPCAFVKIRPILTNLAHSGNNQIVAPWYCIDVLGKMIGKYGAYDRTTKKRRRPDSNRCIEVLQTSALPLGYVALSKFIIAVRSGTGKTGLAKNHLSMLRARHLCGKMVHNSSL
jgi:hypothetical protein